jgi:CspA family cold shock protein
MTDRESGIVKWFDNSKEYGFIQRDGGGDGFVHYSPILDVGYRTLAEGQRVEIEVVEGVEGPQAQNLYIVDSISDSVWEFTFLTDIFYIPSSTTSRGWGF